MSRLDRIRELENGLELPSLPTTRTGEKTQTPLHWAPAKPAKAPFDPFAVSHSKGNESFSAAQPQNQNSGGVRCATRAFAANQTPVSYLKAVPAEWLDGYAILREMAPPDTWPPSLWPKTVRVAKAVPGSSTPDIRTNTRFFYR